VIAAILIQIFMRGFFDGTPLRLGAAVALFACALAAAYWLLVRRLPRQD